MVGLVATTVNPYVDADIYYKTPITSGQQFSVSRIILPNNLAIIQFANFYTLQK